MGALTGKVALITGSSRGIGRAVAKKLAADGARVAVNYVSDKESADAVVADIKAAGGEAAAFQADMGKLPDVRRLFEEATGHFGGLDILVLCAGFFQFKPLATMEEAEYDALFAVNTKGTFFALQEAARRIGQDGRIVMLSAASTGGTGAPNNGAATGSKAASEHFVKSAAKELADRGVTANIVSPGPTMTDNFHKLPEVVRQNAARLSPFNRVGEVRDIVDVIRFLVGEEARWITGQNIRATGGG